MSAIRIAECSHCGSSTMAGATATRVDVDDDDGEADDGLPPPRRMKKITRPKSRPKGRVTIVEQAPLQEPDSPSSSTMRVPPVPGGACVVCVEDLGPECVRACSVMGGTSLVAVVLLCVASFIGGVMVGMQAHAECYT